MANHSTQGGAAIDFAAFRLFDSEGKPVGNPSKESSTGEGNAFKLFSQDVAPGGLVLEGLAGNFATDIRIQQPVWCSAGWCTLIFIGVNSKTGVPDLNTVSIYLWRIGHSFAPETPVDAIPNDPATNFVMESQRYTELALHSLVNGRSLLSMEEVDTNLLIQKFSNPMLGILGCHLLLRQTPIDETMIATVLRNLDGLVPGHPDVVALRVLARQAGLKNLTGETPPVAWPPMLRQGFLALRDEYWQQPKAVQPGSLYDRVRTRVLSGGVWTRWIAGEETVPVNRPGKSRIPSILRRPRSIPAFASGIASRSRNAFSYARELVRGGTKVHPDDLKWSGLSRQEASTMLRLVSETIRRGPRTVMKIAARKKKAVKAKKSPRARGTNGFVKKAVVAKKFAAKKVSARRSKGRPRASR